jgi:hypothetical protein
MKKEIQIEDGTEIGVKRFYMPGVVLNFDCKKCGHKMENDYNSDYLSYPEIGEQTIMFYCDECDSEHELTINFKISIEYNEDTFKLV